MRDVANSSFANDASRRKEILETLVPDAIREVREGAWISQPALVVVGRKPLASRVGPSLNQNHSHTGSQDGGGDGNEWIGIAKSEGTS